MKRRNQKLCSATLSFEMQLLAGFKLMDHLQRGPFCSGDQYLRSSLRSKTTAVEERVC